MNDSVITTEMDVFVILPFHMHTINLSIHLDIGSAKHRCLHIVSNVAESLGKEKCATLFGFYVFSGDDCTMHCIQGKARPIRQLYKNPRFHIAYRQLGVEWNIQRGALEQLEHATYLMHWQSQASSVN